VLRGSTGNAMRLKLTSWLTLRNDNGQSFPDAELMAVAGRLNVTSDYESLADPPEARPLQLMCYPLGHTWAGSPIEAPVPPPPPAPPMAPQMMARNEAIVVTANRLNKAMIAREENLGDLKLYRVPERVTVAAKALKQVAFLDKGAVSGKLMYQSECQWWSEADGPAAAQMRFETVNDTRHGLGVSLPTGGITFFEPSSRGDLFVGEQQVSDYASGQDVEIPLGDSAQVFATCMKTGPGEPGKQWSGMEAVLINADPHPVTLRLKLGSPLEWHVRGLAGTRLKDGETVYEVAIPANGKRQIRWDIRSASSEQAVE
jgi:hypothetical protein